MVSKNLFKTTKSVPVANTVNKAGGKAYSLTSKEALANLVVTGCLNGTYYASASEQLGEIKKHASNCDPEFVAKLAVYARKNADMKDTPAYLLALLFSSGETELVSRIFGQVIDNMKMLCNFVQIVRSGETGRKSFGTLGKNLINSWLVSRNAERLFKDNVGHSAPSLTDIIKMTHPRATDDAQNNMFKYILGKDYDEKLLPAKVRNFEKFKVGKSKVVPDVDFRLLSNITLTEAQWKNVAENMSWTSLRMNLNNLNKHGVFKGETLTTLANKLRDEKEVKNSRCFPYQLLTTYKNTNDVPVAISNALQDAMEVATSNVQSFDCSVAVCVDISGSMDSPVTGNRGSVTSKTTCRDVAALVASTVLRRNDDSVVVPFHTSVVPCKLNPRDSIMTNAKILANLPSGGTSCSSALVHLNKISHKGELVIFVSDNMSWADYQSSYYSGTAMQKEWQNYKKRNPKAKLVLIDVQPNSTTQVQSDKDVLNVGGWSDECFNVINNFVRGESKSFIAEIERVSI